jgi:hypothetical protein
VCDRRRAAHERTLRDVTHARSQHGELARQPSVACAFGELLATHWGTIRQQCGVGLTICHPPRRIVRACCPVYRIPGRHEELMKCAEARFVDTENEHPRG